MSSCAVIQNKNFVFVASDTSVCKEIDGVHKRIAYYDKSFMVAENKCIFMSGDIVECASVRKYLTGLKKIDANKIKDKLLDLKRREKICGEEKALGITIIGLDKIVAMDSRDDFKITEVFPDTRELGINVNVFSYFTDEIKSIIMSEIERKPCLSAEVIIDMFVDAYNKFLCADVGGQLDIWYIHKNGFSHTRKPLEDNTPFPNDTHEKLAEYIDSYLTIGNGMFSVDKNGNVYAGSMTLDNGLLSGATIKGSVIEAGTLKGGSMESGTIKGGTIEASTINSVEINGGTINGVEITGSEFLQVGSSAVNSGDVGIKDGRVYLYSKNSNGNVSNVKGLLTYDTNGSNKVYLQSNGVPLKVESVNSDMSLDAINGKIWMGSDVWLKSGVTIRKADGTEVGGSGVATFG